MLYKEEKLGIKDFFKKKNVFFFVSWPSLVTAEDNK